MLTSEWRVEVREAKKGGGSTGLRRGSAGFDKLTQRLTRRLRRRPHPRLPLLLSQATSAPLGLFIGQPFESFSQCLVCLADDDKGIGIHFVNKGF